MARTTDQPSQASPRFWRRRYGLLWMLPIAALIHLGAALSPATVETVYGEWLYPSFAGVLTAVSGFLPFAIGEWLVITFIVIVVLRFAWVTLRVLRQNIGVWRALGNAVLHWLLLLAFVYPLFLAMWGFNYLRPSLAQRVQLDTSPATESELRALCEELVDQCNVLRPLVSQDQHGAMRILDPFEGTARRALIGYATLQAVAPGAEILATAKPVLASEAMSWLGISGIYFPFTGEANVNTTLPHAMLPFVICHEMAHQRGIAPEDEANFLGFLSCVAHPDGDFRYSGNFAGLRYALAALKRVDAAAASQMLARLDPGCLRDMEALRAWGERYHGPLQKVSERTNDLYLKANRQGQGTQSYGAVVDLLIAWRRAKEAHGVAEHEKA